MQTRPTRAPLLLLALALTACSPCGGGRTTTEPAAKRITVLPMGGEAGRQVEGVKQALAERYPGLPVTALPAEPIPAGVEREAGGAVSAERLMQGLQERGPGLLVLLDADLGSSVQSAVYSQVDFPHGNAVVAFARFRTADGTLPAPGASLSPEAVARADQRTRRQAVTAVGRLLAPFPCKEQHCFLHRSGGVEDIDAADRFCERHTLLLERALQSIRAAQGGTSAQGTTTAR